MADNMIRLMVRRGIRVRREIGGVLTSVTPTIGQPFDFLRSEVEHLFEKHPSHVRELRQEGADYVNQGTGPLAVGDLEPGQDRIPAVNTGAKQAAAKQALNIKSGTAAEVDDL